ncbi:MAG: right-handed parallel beta-helix repeat-containing protein [Prevotella sp.]|nr:right-handed parallel beta-helix repeat-containing protein [Prevotella sp.]
MMNKVIILIANILLLANIMLLASCSDDDTFSTSPSFKLTFSADTLSLDTVFSTVPSHHKQLVVYNNNADGMRISMVSLESGTRTQFRVNVNGSYLSGSLNDPVENLELRKGDSIRVFVEVTTRANGDTLPKLVNDNLVFLLENGSRQKVNLNVWSWDATLLRKATFSKDTTLAAVKGKPIVVYDTLTVGPEATLTIAPKTTLYFHSDAGIDVKGTLKISGEKDNEVTLRPDRLDRMVTNLTYDNNPGQWRGINYRSGSFGNTISYADIHGATDAIVCDSSDVSREKLSIDHSTIHNNSGTGVSGVNNMITIENTQISNSATGCLNFIGGNIEINHCTVAQYYPFDSNRGPALYFTNALADVPYPLTMDVYNSIIKGYADDVVIWATGDADNHLDVTFKNSVVRTEPGKDYEYMFSDCVIEDPKDTLLSGKSYFKLFDTDNFIYDFTPKKTLGSTETINPSIRMADAMTTLPDDRTGKARKESEKHDAGCYEVTEE